MAKFYKSYRSYKTVYSKNKNGSMRFYRTVTAPFGKVYEVTTDADGFTEKFRTVPTRLVEKSQGGKELLVWKKCRVVPVKRLVPEYIGPFSPYVPVKLRILVLVKLRIPAGVWRVQPENWKCRAAKAVVVGFYNMDGKKAVIPDGHQVVSAYDDQFVYQIGETIEPNGNPRDFLHSEECGPGIHFFLTRKEARGYII